MSQSEIVRFRQQQAAEEEAAKLGLSGLAAVASHESIVARMEQDGEYLLQLFKQGRDEEALRLKCHSTRLADILPELEALFGI